MNPFQLNTYICSIYTYSKVYSEFICLCVTSATMSKCIKKGKEKREVLLVVVTKLFKSISPLF